MKYQLNKAEPSNELFGAIIGGLFLFLMAKWSIEALIDSIKEACKSLPDKIKEKLQKLADDGYLSPGVDDDGEAIFYQADYPNASLTDAKDGRHWEIDQNLRKEIIADNKEMGDNSDPLVAYEVVDVSDYLSILNRYEQFLQFLLSANTSDKDIGRKTESKFSSLFNKKEVDVKFESSKPVVYSVSAKTTDITWPNHPYFKQPEQVCKQIQAVVKKCNATFIQMTKKIPEWMADPNSKDKNYLAQRLTYLKYVYVALEMYQMVLRQFDFSDLTLNNDETFGSCLILKDKNGRDITDHH